MVSRMAQNQLDERSISQASEWSEEKKSRGGVKDHYQTERFQQPQSVTHAYTWENSSKSISFLNKLVYWQPRNREILALAEQGWRWVHICAHPKSSSRLFCNCKMIACSEDTTFIDKVFLEAILDLAVDLLFVRDQEISCTLLTSFHAIYKIHCKHSKVKPKKPVIILTFTPRFSALLIVSALSWRGGSNNGNNPQNSQGPPALSLSPSGTSYILAGQKSHFFRNWIKEEDFNWQIYIKELQLKFNKKRTALPYLLNFLNL